MQTFQVTEEELTRLTQGLFPRWLIERPAAAAAADTNEATAAEAAVKFSDLVQVNISRRVEATSKSVEQLFVTILKRKLDDIVDEEKELANFIQQYKQLLLWELDQTTNASAAQGETKAASDAPKLLVSPLFERLKDYKGNFILQFNLNYLGVKRVLVIGEVAKIKVTYDIDITSKYKYGDASQAADAAAPPHLRELLGYRYSWWLSASFSASQ